MTSHTKNQIGSTVGQNSVTLMFPPDKRFAAYGVLGVPLVPTTVSTGRLKEVRLSVVLELKQNVALSMPEVVCLEIGGGTLCSTGLALHAAALFSKCTKRSAVATCSFEHIEPFFSAQRTYFVPLEKPQRDRRLTLSDVHSIYGYTGTPEWSFISIELVYRFACQNACPETVALDTAGLVLLGQESVFTGTMKFTRSRTTSYSPATQIQ